MCVLVSVHASSHGHNSEFRLIPPNRIHLLLDWSLIDQPDLTDSLSSSFFLTVCTQKNLYQTFADGEEEEWKKEEGKYFHISDMVN
jgi:hypothetical protein